MIIDRFSAADTFPFFAAPSALRQPPFKRGIFMNFVPVTALIIA